MNQQHEHHHHHQQHLQPVVIASRAVLSPASDNTTRSSASTYVEEWIVSCSWSDWVNFWRLIQKEQDSLSLQLLSLQLLQSKIRKQITMENYTSTANQPEIVALQSELASHLFPAGGSPNASSSSSYFSQIASTACICFAALAVRCGHLAELVAQCRQSIFNYTAPHQQHQLFASLKILGNLPKEVQSCGWCTTSQQLVPYKLTVLETLQHFLVSDASKQHLSPNPCLVTALECLRHWITALPISLVELQPCQILEILIHMLSSSNAANNNQREHERVIVEASRALTQAVTVTQEPGESSQDNASRPQALLHLLLQSLPNNGFIIVPYEQAIRDNVDETAFELSILLSTLVCEAVDEGLVEHQLPPALWAVMTKMQLHPDNFTIRRSVCDVWLTIQDIPKSERHVSYHSSLFEQLLPILIKSIEYSDEYDQDEWKDYRQSIQDVLVSTYFLLRSTFVQLLHIGAAAAPAAPGATTHHNSIVTWQSQEAALFGLTVTAREVCNRIRDNKAKNLQQDRLATCISLFSLLQHLLAIACNQQQQHPALVKSIVCFIGAYATTWDAVFSTGGITNNEGKTHSIIHLLEFLQHTMTSKASVAAAANNQLAQGDHIDDEFALCVYCAKSIRAVLLGSSPTLLQMQLQPSTTATPNNILHILQQLFHASTTTENEHAMGQVAQGVTRLLIQTQDGQKSLVHFVQPILQAGEAALHTIQSNPNDHHMVLWSTRSLGRYLQVYQIIIRFGSDGRDNQSFSVGVIQPLWIFLEKISQQQNLLSTEDLLEKVVGAHEQILKSVPQQQMTPHLSTTLQYVVNLFQQYKNPSAVSYMSRAVEEYGSSHVQEFQELLDHVSGVIFAYTSAAPIEESTDLLRAFFEMNQRFILYCPAALVGSKQFPSIVACAAECITACNGERESTCAVLVFLSQLFGWRSLRLSVESQSQLSASHTLDELLLQHGEKIICSCMATLTSGAQMLGPACTECMFAVLAPVANWGKENDSTVAQQWLVTAKPPDGCNDQIFQQVVSIFIGLVQNDSAAAVAPVKNKAKAKMLLTDFCKICKGEMSIDALATYHQ